MKILILSAEVWQDGTNGGNVLSNLFAGSEHEFAQVYCNPGLPQNSVCRRYYQMTAAMAIRGFFRHRPIGKAFRLDSEGSGDGRASVELPDRRFIRFFHRFSWGIFHFAEFLVWNLSNWKNDGLRRFILDFAPDVIFAPCYGSVFLLRLTRFAAGLTRKRIISYISDDAYTLRQFNLDPFFWIIRLLTRRELRKTFPCYSLVYTMTEAQKRQCERDFSADMKILRKANPWRPVAPGRETHSPVRLIFAGGIYLDRWKILGAVSDALRRINADGVKMVLDIYTANEVSARIGRRLNDGRNCFLHEPVSMEELGGIYRSSDIALHVESFDLKHRLLVRMSFSTKIVDCLGSGCAVMAICDSRQGGYVYLKDQDAAICIDDLAEVPRVLARIAAHPEIVYEYRLKAFECCRRNHDPARIRKGVFQDFERISRQS